MAYVKKNIFSKTLLSKYLKDDESLIINYGKYKKNIVNEWITLIKSKGIYTKKEKSLQGKFLDDIFSKVLDYKSFTQDIDTWNLNIEQITNIDSKFADGSLGFFTNKTDDVRVVIELKDANVVLDARQNRLNDNRTPIEQAFSYQHKIGKSCKWVIISNFVELLLYHSGSSTEYELFQIDKLNDFNEFNRFNYLLNRKNLISEKSDSVIDILYSENEIEKENITDKFYSQYKDIRTQLFDYIKNNNPQIPELILLEKTQKILDRIIFVRFCEDNLLLPNNKFNEIIESVNKIFDISETKFWDELKDYFKAINSGSTHPVVNKFNGGLFADDDIIDNLIINNSIFESINNIINYNFVSDIDVNILGHIFEKSISDIEELRCNLSEKKYDKKKGNQKKYGAFYTPDYITNYIVDNSIGAWCVDKKNELGYDKLPDLSDEELKFQKKGKSKTKIIDDKQQHINFWISYFKALSEIKVLDPACGSGAFLNQAFIFLKKEFDFINDNLLNLNDNKILYEIGTIEGSILTKNLFGVDIMNEAVEITKLSLWIKTANSNSPLTILDNNIKCGNSLIDDPEIAGDKAFDWHKEFPDVMKNGGFDVIIGNPPYGARLTTTFIEKRHLEQIYNIGSTDNAVLFLKKTFLLLKQSGKYGFIIPKSFIFASNYSQIRDFLFDYFNKIVDCKKVWKEVKLEQAIIIIDKGKISNTYMTNKLINKEIIYKDTIDKSYIKQFGFILNDVTENELKISLKVISNSKFLNDISYNIPGVPNQKYINDNLGDYKMIGGAEISRFGIIDFKGKIDKKWVKDNGAFIVKNSVLVQNIIAHIENPVDHIKIIACIPEEKYIGVLTLANTINQIVVKKEFFQNYSNKLVWLILNSKFINWYVYRFIFGKAIRTMHFYNPVTSRIPIPHITPEAQLPFIELADIMLAKNKELLEIKNKFINFINGKYDNNKFSNKLQNWYELSFKDLLIELSKSKIKLSLDEQYAWQELFEKHKATATEIKNIIDETDRKIEKMIYELYGLTEEEISVVEGI